MVDIVKRVKVFDGEQIQYESESEALNCTMRFSMFLPPQAATEALPLLWWLSGLTCTDENFFQKAGAQRMAAQLGIAIVCPDTSPRGLNLPGEHDSYDFGSGAGFYLNATQAPWCEHYRMDDYITQELPKTVYNLFNYSGKQSISGHSMGGHGALVLALNNPGKYESVSAFAPITNPTECPWGHKNFTQHLGPDTSSWKAYDACELVLSEQSKQPLLIDQGSEDEFLVEQLNPQNLVAACKQVNHPLQYQLREGYDHSYYFISSFIGEHLLYHQKYLGSK